MIGASIIIALLWAGMTVPPAALVRRILIGKSQRKFWGL